MNPTTKRVWRANLLLSFVPDLVDLVNPRVNYYDNVAVIVRISNGGGDGGSRESDVRYPILQHQRLVRQMTALFGGSNLIAYNAIGIHISCH